MRVTYETRSREKRGKRKKRKRERGRERGEVKEKPSRRPSWGDGRFHNADVSFLSIIR